MAPPNLPKVEMCFTFKGKNRAKNPTTLGRLGRKLHCVVPKSPTVSYRIIFRSHARSDLPALQNPVLDVPLGTQPHLTVLTTTPGMGLMHAEKRKRKPGVPAVATFADGMQATTSF